jgi:hypothetical protein
MEAWIDLLLMANHKDTRLQHGSEVIQVKRGEIITSEVKLMDRWKWSKEKTRRFLSLLASDEMIEKKSDRRKTIITIVNYCNFQQLQTTNRPHTDHQETTERPQRDHRRDTINKSNNVNTKDYAFNVSMMESEYEKLCTKHGKEIADDCIDYLSSYKAANPNYKRKSDYLTIIRWVVDTVEKNDHRSLGNMPLYVASDGLIKQLEKANAIDQQRSL